MKELIKNMPHLHTIFLLTIIGLVIWKLSSFMEFMSEAMSEQLPDGTKGKASTKRIIMMMFASYFIYAGVYTLHTNTKPDYYMITVDVVFLLLALRILMPEQANSLLDKLKSLTTFKQEKNEDGSGKTEINKVTTQNPEK